MSIVLLTSCANAISSRFVFSDPSGMNIVIQIPKEIEAKALEISIDPKTGVFTLTAASWTSRNVQTIKAQGERESVISGAISEGIVEGAVKGIKGFP